MKIREKKHFPQKNFKVKSYNCRMRAKILKTDFPPPLVFEKVFSGGKEEIRFMKVNLLDITSVCDNFQQLGNRAL